MAKRKKRERVEADQNDVISLIELRCGIMQHCQAIKAVTGFLADGKTQAAIARLDSATTALSALIRGQCAGVTMKCPRCGSEQDVVAWVDDRTCTNCGGPLEPPKVPGEE